MSVLTKKRKTAVTRAVFRPAGFRYTIEESLTGKEGTLDARRLQSFRGNKRMLMVQIINDEPPSPRKLDAAVPRDLETICLKCLEKSPERRYATAHDLADELQRFLDGEPILARPVGRFERGWRWCQRKPAIAALTFAALLLLMLTAGIATAAYFREVALSTALAGRGRDLQKKTEDLAQKTQDLAKARSRRPKRPKFDSASRRSRRPWPRPAPRASAGGLGVRFVAERFVIQDRQRESGGIACAQRGRCFARLAPR